MSNAQVHRISVEFLHSKWDSELPAEIIVNEDNIVNNFFRSLGEDIGLTKTGNTKIIVGLNGSGKSTFLNLLSEMYSIQGSNKPPEGKDLINLMEKWKSKGIVKFKSKIDFQYDYIEEYLTGEKIDRIDTQFMVEVLSSERAISRFTPLSDDFDSVLDENFSNNNSVDAEVKKFKQHFHQILDNPEKNEKEIREYFETFCDQEEAMDPEWSVHNAELDLSLESEFDFSNDKWRSKLLVDYRDHWQLLDVKKAIHVDFELNFDSPFGPSDFHETMLEILSKISQKIGVELRWDDFYGPCKFPKIRPKYISPMSLSSKPQNIDDDLFECIRIEGEEEIILEDKNWQDIVSLFDVKKGSMELGDKFRTFSEYEYNLDIGSDEYFSNNTHPHYPITGNIEFIFKDHSPEYWSYDQIYACKILPDHRQDFFIHRWQNEVIYHPVSGIIYSRNRNSIYDYLKRDLWRNINRRNRIHLLSKLFEVPENSLNALFAVNDLSPLNGRYLTSGQYRVFTLFETASNDDFDLLLIDEPEVSLHIDWQRKILDKISEYTNAKFIISATHSPDIIYHHLDNVIEFDSIHEN